ncbi:unnamed protein product [Trifolium pratense]|uniref:Uncharacterized protein n=1 Tax=Trifolium pratense TaxID=57577 RepID=A0ACB0K6A0_TRIPR|nr:unnamed protein product [Trifolium pratense]
MGKRSPFLTGKYKHPSLRDWDVKMANQDIQKVYDVMGLEHGLTAGVTQLNTTDERSFVMCFDPNTCPLSEAEMHLNHCRACIQIYSTSVGTLERRISQAKGKTLRYKSSANRKKEDKKEEKSDEMKEEKNDEKKDDKIEEKKDEKKDEKGDEKKHEEKDETNETNDETKDVGCGVDKKNDEHPSSEEEEFDVDKMDDLVKTTCNVGLSPTQETILKFPEFFDAPEGSRRKKEDPMKETPSKKDSLDNKEDPIKKTPSRHDPVEEQKDIIEPTPLRIVLPDQIIDLSQEVAMKPKRRKHEVVEDRTYLDRRRAVKNSKKTYPPLLGALHSIKILYCSGFHKFSLQRCDLWTLNKDKWVHCFVVNIWVNCLNWGQRTRKMRRLVTRYVNHDNLERPGALEMDQATAFRSFVDKLKWFKYLNWKKIDPTKLEYIMTPALIGNPGSHYVCFVVNFKSCTFQFLNSVTPRFLEYIVLARSKRPVRIGSPKNKNYVKTSLSKPEINLVFQLRKKIRKIEVEKR